MNAGVTVQNLQTPEAQQAWFAAAPHRVDIVVYPGFESLEVFSLISVFSHANRELERRGDPRRYQVEVVSPENGLVTSDCGAVLMPSRRLSMHELPDTAMIVSSHDIEGALEGSKQIVQWCGWAADQVKRLVGLCSGSFFLAESGLLDSRPATTHWSVVDLMRSRYPGVQVDSDALFVRAGKFWTSAGLSAAVDLGLAFVEDDCGRDIALDVARALVVHVKRPGGQSQISTNLHSEMTSSTSIRDIQSWILQNLHRKISVGDLAKRMAMSTRNFSRIFHTETGLSPGQFIQRARVEKSLRLLEDSSLPMKTVAHRCGFGSDEHLRKVFQKRLAMTAREYRLHPPSRY